MVRASRLSIPFNSGGTLIQAFGNAAPVAYQAVVVRKSSVNPANGAVRRSSTAKGTAWTVGIEAMVRCRSTDSQFLTSRKKLLRCR